MSRKIDKPPIFLTLLGDSLVLVDCLFWPYGHGGVRNTTTVHCLLEGFLPCPLPLGPVGLGFRSPPLPGGRLGLAAPLPFPLSPWGVGVLGVWVCVCVLGSALINDDDA